MEEKAESKKRKPSDSADSVELPIPIAILNTSLVGAKRPESRVYENYRQSITTELTEKSIS